MRDLILYALGVIVVCILCWLVPNLYNNKVSEDEIWWEYYQLSDSSYVRIIHSYDCETKKPLIRWNVQCKILGYRKHKNDVYDFCIHDDDAEMLNCISKRNIKRSLEYQYIFAEDERDLELLELDEKILDTTDRKYEVYYSFTNDAQVIPIENTEVLLEIHRKTIKI